ncbi:uncharacterized protein LOC107048512 isoform X2 [Diachasma alloeum]|uniref:uncharacterized protein LOC107048512 isoform X2 n=1 Tax=Diachasma alloeum TaxID=454923 RepID=UPI0007381D7E|nr:uncharacterized protein LOC107048512 isoform X2 [Diachasma alloeum]
MNVQIQDAIKLKWHRIFQRMPEEMRAHPGAGLNGFSQVQQDDEAPAGQCNGRTRPVSFYDNYKDVSAMPPCVTSAASVGNLNQVRENGATTTITLVASATSVGNVSKIQGNNRATGHIAWMEPDNTRDNKDLDKAPTMTNCLSTTVPVNLAASQIAGRHTPTRSSLRHSRMIVMHRNGNVRKSRPPLLRHRKLARTLAAVQTILGIAVTSLALWLLLWSPNLPLSDNPHWSGMPLLLSGGFGICLLCCFKKEYPGMSPGFCLSATKTISVFLSILATLACLLACSAAIIHLAKLSGLECTPARVRNATCACRPKSEIASPAEPVLKYVDLNCPEVEGILTILLILSACCNGLGTIIAGWYLYLHWSTRDKRPKYIKVRTSNPSVLDSRPIYNPNLHNR